MHSRPASLLLSACLLLSSGIAAAAAPDSGRADEEVRNTVVNLLQNLVERGVLTRDQAEKIVRDAQAKAAADAAATAAQAEAEKDAVRIPHVPEIVKEEIRRQVQADVAAQVTQDVQQAAKDEGWGVPAALPDWVRRMRWSSDLRVRAESDLFASDNTERYYLDLQRVNDAGGIGLAGADPYINTAVNRHRLRGRLRLGFDTLLGYGWSMGARIATGDLRNPVSTNMTLGNGGGRYAIGLDLAWLNYNHVSRTVRHTIDLSAGRMRNPFVVPTELVYDQDLNLDGVAGSYRLGLQRDSYDTRYVFATAGAFPLQEVELSSHDKWLLGGQLGLDWRFENRSRLRASAAYYDFRNVAGRRNAFDSDLLDYTAPLYLSKGNTVQVFDIRNDTPQSTNLFALAADYRVVNYALSFDKRVGEGHRIALNGEYAQNVGYKVSEVLDRSGYLVPRRNVGYQGELSVGTATMARTRAWQMAVGYRYVQSDAVLDAFTDSDFRLGGTDAKGYYARLDYGFSPMVALRLKYMSGTEIDGPPLGIDVLQLDLTASF